MMFFVVGFLWLALVPSSGNGIQISPEAGLRNASTAIIRTADDDFVPIPTPLTENRTLGKEISTSERARRLIPYMAFYLPSTEFPINQQYVAQVPSKQHIQHQSQQKAQKQQQQHTPAAIPLPTAYVHMKVPINNQQNQQSRLTQTSQRLPTQPVFQTIVYGGQHPLTQAKETGKHTFSSSPLQHSLLPSTAGGTQRVQIPVAYKQEANPNKQKSVSPQQFHQSQQLQSQNINLTPFTPTNTVPGHFIPIIYSNEQGNNANYKPTAPSSPSVERQQQQQQQHHHRQYNELSSNAQKFDEHILSHQSGHLSGASLKQQAVDEYHRHRQQQGDLVVTIPGSPVTTSELVPKTLSQIKQHERQHLQYVAVSPTPSTPASSTYRVLTDNRHQPQQQLQHHSSQPVQVFEQQPVSSSDNLTPQQKYVIYLQQQLRYKQQQQLQEHKDKHTQLEKHLQQTQPHQHQQPHYQLQQPDKQQNRQYPQSEHVYVLSTTPSPVSSSTPQPTAPQSIDIHHGNHHNQNRFNEKYPQHSPIGHVVYQHPEVITNPEQILHPSKQQPLQPSYVPLAQRPEPHRYAQNQLPPHQYANNPNYIEYVIDDPKQEIEEQSTSPEKDQHHGIRPPPVLLGSTPLPAPPPVEVVVTSPRPYYKNQPTLRLHAISPTPRPSPRPYAKSTPAPPMVFVSSKPKYSQHYPSATPKPIKLKPSQKYPVDVPKYTPVPDDDPLPDIKTSSLAEILRKLQESNHLPQTLTPDNIDNSIRTLIKILHNLKRSQTIVENPPQHHEEDYDYNSADVEVEDTPPEQDTFNAPMPSAKPGPNSGRPGIDYPTLASIPETSFSCQEQRYKGFFGDPETNCQVWHYCDLNGGKASFLCPNGTIFSQIALTCDWWFNVKCATTPQLYVLNERLYKYILPFTPKFPEDYSGPLVDKYLALKFKEMEEKMRREKLKGRGDGETEDGASDDVTKTSLDDGSSTAGMNTKEGTLGSGDGSLAPIGEQSSERNLLIDEENGRITSRGSAASTHTSTTTTKSVETTTKELPLSLRPIVVSTTSLPYSMQSSEEDDDDSQSVEPRLGEKISVEKVEVIEIKSDGTSGHLIPENRYSSSDT